jgi:hypothetical protein
MSPSTSRRSEAPGGEGGRDIPTASRGEKQLFEVQLEVREMESGTMAIQEREDEIARLMNKFGE